MQLPYIPVTALSLTDLLLDRISFEWDSRGSTTPNHKKIIDVTASLDRNCLSFSKERYTKNRSVCENAATYGVASSYSSAPGCCDSVWFAVSSISKATMLG